MPPKRPHLPAERVYLVPLFALLAACGSKERERPPYQANPTPQDAHEVVITVHDAPEDMYVSSAAVTYRIANDNCLPPIDNFEGVRYGDEFHFLRIPMQRIDASTFSGVYYGDGVKRADYFGRGICNWRVRHVVVALKTKATASFTYFLISASPARKSETRYARKDIQPLLDDGKVYPASDFSQEMFDQEVPESERSEFFSYSILIRPKQAEQ